MNIKSLLLGSAAAFVAVSGARAADAVVQVEPEPAEYVRICDTYGTGFFYIPGTETCLKVGGYVRMRLEAQDNTTNNDIDLDNLNSASGAAGTIVFSDGSSSAVGGVTGNVPGFFIRGNGNDDYNVGSRVRARVEFDAREETELGMLRSFIRLQATNNAATNSGQGTINNGVGIDQAYIQLGGLTIGKLDSLWAERDGLFTDNDWSVGDLGTNRISYTFAVAGFTAAVSVEDDGSGDFVPDVVGQLAYEGGWGEAYVSGVYDEQSNIGGIGRSAGGTGAFNYAIPSYANTFIVDSSAAAGFQPGFATLYNGDLNDSDDGAFALKAGVTLKDLIMAGGQFKVEGHYAFDPTVYAGDTGGNYIVPGGAFRGQGIFTGAGAGALPTVVNLTSTQSYNLVSEWQVGAGYQQQLDKLFLAVSGVYGETFDLKQSVNTVTNGVSTVSTFNLGNAEYWGVAGNVGYNITSNFSVLGEVSYREVDLPSSISNDLDTTAGFVEFKRTF
ncbi:MULTISPECIES: porin [unclassified Aureimonas]|uniref:porin n=1 Tax=unclassified Aureimonas TaxID=2615206 RepID=UPI0006F4D06B|nr:MULTISPECIES: porin [unclassified Aureimonas]KQT55299.1 hypothetical protein ASG62_10775 [Aureimonas sp. Leaf427]KQT71090.1 hypothetical protein ASG54_21160 [Aureimonas sp. Leaf460]